MKLQSRHVGLLTPLEQRVYSSLLNSVDSDQERRDYYISQSHRYRNGDENVLPFPERSKKGVMLLSLCKLLKTNKTSASVILEPTVPNFAGHVKDKLLALGAEKVYAVPPSQLLAAIYGKGKEPFSMYRDNAQFSLPGIPSSDEKKLLCMINPPPHLVTHSSEYSIQGILLRSPKTRKPNYIPPLFTEAAKLALTDVTDLNDGRLWLSSEGAT